MITSWLDDLILRAWLLYDFLLRPLQALLIPAENAGCHSLVRDSICLVLHLFELPVETVRLPR